MPTKKPIKSKRLQPARLIKTNGKFSWKKMTVIVVLLAAVGTIVIRNSFASNLYVFYNGAPQYQLRSSGDIFAKDSGGIHFRNPSMVTTYNTGTSTGSLNYFFTNPSGVSMQTCFIDLDVESADTNSKLVHIVIRDDFTGHNAGYDYSLKEIALLMSSRNSLKVNVVDSFTKLQIVRGDLCIDTTYPRGTHKVRAELNTYTGTYIVGAVKHIWMTLY